jgi:hypothetical protein
MVSAQPVVQHAESHLVQQQIPQALILAATASTPTALFYAVLVLQVGCVRLLQCVAYIRCRQSHATLGQCNLCTGTTANQQLGLGV